jgi:hypothetical protein
MNDTLINLLVGSLGLLGITGSAAVALIIKESIKVSSGK